MRGHGDEVTAASLGCFDYGLIRLPIFDFHDLARDTDPLGLLLSLGEATIGVGMGMSRELINVRVRGPQRGCWEPRDNRECQTKSGNGAADAAHQVPIAVVHADFLRRSAIMRPRATAASLIWASSSPALTALIRASMIAGSLSRVPMPMAALPG